MTLPNLTIEKHVLVFMEEKACSTISENLFDAPITFVGLTALSELISTMFLIFSSCAAFAKK